MNIETCIKYLDYVSHECTRHLNDGRVTDDELVNLIIDVQRFKEKCMGSDLPHEIKSKISDIEMNYSIKRVERGTWYLLAAFASFGSWALIIYMRQQSKRKQALNEIKFDTSRLSSFIRLNY
ncbi:MAG: hypothetical protein COA33_003735 [Fluviicola sp.]|nr:hypothetical protein [Fluviicola sp.]